MKKSTITKLFAIFFILPIFLFSCVETQPDQNPDDNQGEVNPPKDSTVTPPSTEPTLEIVAGEATSTTLTFTISTANIDKCSWVCIPDGEKIPEDIFIIQQGTAIDVADSPSICTATGLNPDTDYAVVAAIMSKKGYATDTVYMSTAIATAPTISIKTTDVSFNYISIVINTKDATNGAWGIIKAEDEAPTNESVMETGNKIPDMTSGEVSININAVEADTDYKIIVVAEGLGGISRGELEVTTAKTPEGVIEEPEIILDEENTELTAHKAIVPFSLKNIKTASWIVIREGEAMPTAEEILLNGTSINIAENQTDITVTGLHHLTTYTLCVAGIGDGGTTSKNITLITLEDTEAFTFEINQATWYSHLTANGEIFVKFSGNKPKITETAIDFYCADNTNGLTAGTYILNNTKAANTISSANADTYLEIYNSGGAGLEKTVHFTTGSVYVTLENNVYTLDIDLVDADEKHYIATFSGKFEKSK